METWTCVVVEVVMEAMTEVRIGTRDRGLHHDRDRDRTMTEMIVVHET